MSANSERSKKLTTPMGRLLNKSMPSRRASAHQQRAHRGIGARASAGACPTMAEAQDKPAPAPGAKPNILVIWGDDIGQGNISAFTKGLMGYRTPNIDRVANEGMIFTDYYGEQSCTAGRSSFITGQSVFRTGLSKVGLPGADLGLRAEDPTIATLLKAARLRHWPVRQKPSGRQE